MFPLFILALKSFTVARAAVHPWCELLGVCCLGGPEGLTTGDTKVRPRVANSFENGVDVGCIIHQCPFMADDKDPLGLVYSPKALYGCCLVNEFVFDEGYWHHTSYMFSWLASVQGTTVCLEIPLQSPPPPWETVTWRPFASEICRGGVHLGSSRVCDLGDWRVDWGSAIFQTGSARPFSSVAPR